MGEQEFEILFQVVVVVWRGVMGGIVGGRENVRGRDKDEKNLPS